MSCVNKLKCSRKINTLERICEVLKEDLTAELVCEEKMLDDRVALLCFEEFYFRCKSYVALTVMITENDTYQEAVVAGMGGGEGLANISWGANSSFANKAVKSLIKLGFAEA